MKVFLLFFVLFTAKLNAQSILNFDKRFVQSEDRWVAFLPDKDSSYTFGFIYIDEVAGLTFNYEGSFKILSSGKFLVNIVEPMNVKVRLEPNNVLVAFIPKEKFEELHIPALPLWLKDYKTDTGSVAKLYQWGFMYNGWNECAKALTYLQRAKLQDPGYKGLLVEMAFSYNCLERYDSAIFVLNDALKLNPTDAYTNKELIYAEIKSGQLAKASESCKIAIAVCTDTKYNGENCYNLLNAYYKRNDKINFNIWLNETKKWNSKKDNLMKSIIIMENEINK